MSDSSPSLPALIADPTGLTSLVHDLARARVVAVDTESNSLFAYRERVCLIQFSTASGDYLVDPLGFSDLSALAPLFANPRQQKVFHAAEYDILCLKRDYGFEFAAIFDTMIAARTLGWPQLGLAAILEGRFGVKMNKKFQRANWGQRPLTPEQLDYARLDTRYLIPLRDILSAELAAAHRMEEAGEEFSRLARLGARSDANGYGPPGFWRINGARELAPRQAAFAGALRLILEGKYRLTVVDMEGKRIARVKIERLDGKTYRAEGGKFTSCSQPNPRWNFNMTSARIELEDKVVARNVVFKIKSVPVFYLPVIYYPIREDQRSTGILFPHFGHSSIKGFEVGTGFFWAMGRSFDQTFYADHYSKIGWGFGHEFRYAAEQPSRGTSRTYVIRTDRDQPLDYDLDWNALQMLPGKFRATVNVRQYSDLLFQQQYQDNFNLATTRTRRSAGNVQRSFGSNVFSIAADRNETFFGEDTRVQQRLPSATLRRFPQKLGRTGIVFGYEAKAERVGFGASDAVESFSRFDVAPQLSRPLSSTFLQVTPSATVRYTRYTSSYLGEEDATTVLGGPAIGRRFFEGSLDVRGPTFSRVFDVGGPYTDRIKHVIGPEVNWTYRTRVDDFNDIPKFDGIDWYLGTNQIDYAIVQRLLAKRPGPGGKSIPHEFLSLRVGQTYYVQISDGQNNFDPNYSSSAFGPGFTPAHLSPILSRLRLRPVPSVTGDLSVEYDVNFKQLRTIFFSGGINGARGSLQAGWSRVLQLAELAENRKVTANTIRGAGTLQVVPNRITLNGSANYDFVRKVHAIRAHEGWVIYEALSVRERVAACGTDTPDAARTREPVSLPTFRGDGLQPGVDLDDTASLLDVMDEPDARP